MATATKTTTPNKSSGSGQLSLSPDDMMTTLREAVGSMVQDTENFKEEYKASSSRQMDLSTQIADAIEGQAAQSNIVNTAKATAELKAQDATIAAIEGMANPEMQRQLMDKLGADAKQMQAALDKEAEVLGDNGFMGILKQMLNKEIYGTPGGSASFAAQNAAKQYEATSLEIAKITEASDNVSKQNNHLARTLTGASISAAAEATTLQASQLAAEQKLQNVKTNADMMWRVMSADQQAMGSIMEYYRLMDNADARKQQRDAQQKVLDKEASAERALQSKVEAVQRTQMAAWGYTDDPDAIKYNLTSSDANTRAITNKQANLGINKNDFALTFGNTPADARESVQELGATGLVEETVGTKLLVQIEEQMVAEYTESQTPLPNDKVSLGVAYNATAKRVMANYAADIQPGSPYAAPSMEIISSQATVKNGALYKRVLQPMAMTETRPQQIFDAALAGIQSGLVSPEEATVGIQQIFETAKLYNNTQDGGFMRVGLPSQLTYKSSVTIPNPGRSSVLELGRGAANVIGQTSGIVFGVSFAQAAVGSLYSSLAKGMYGSDRANIDFSDYNQVRKEIAAALSRLPKPARPPVGTK